MVFWDLYYPSQCLDAVKTHVAQFINNIHLLKVFWSFKNFFETLHGLNDSDKKTKMLKTKS